MPRINLDKNSFVAGELSPKVYARSDIAQYGQGCRKLVNCFVHPHGGVSGRPGTYYAGDALYPLRRTRLIPFQYSTTAAYVIEAGDLYFRFWLNGGRLEDGGSPVEVTTPWDHHDVFKLQWAQEADVMYLVHPDFEPYKLSRTSPTSFTLDVVTWNSGRAPLGPFNLDVDNELSTNVAGTTYDRRLTFEKDYFSASDIGRVLYARNTAQAKASFYEIRQIVSAKIIEVDTLYDDPVGANPTTTSLWALGLMSAGYGCNAVTFHESRLWFGGFKRQIDGIAGSVSDDFENFEVESPDPDVNDAGNADKAIFRRTVSNEINAVRWLRSAADQLIIGTSGAEFKARGDNEDSLTPTGATVKVVTERGSAEIPAVVVDNNIFFIQRSNSTIRRFGFSVAADGLTSRNFSILSDHMLRNGKGVSALVYQSEPIGQLWLPRRDGQLVSWAFEPEQEVSGPARHILGGNYLGGNPVVESVAMLKGAVALNPRSEQTGFDGPATSIATNPGAESAATTGWTVATGTWDADTDEAAVFPQGGSYFFKNSSATADAEMHQTVDLSGLGGINNILIDEGRTTMDVSVFLTSYAASSGQFIMQALDGTGAVQMNLYDTGTVTPISGEWDGYASTEMELPPGCRKIKFRLIGSPTGVTAAAGMCFDNLTFSLSQTPIAEEGSENGNEDQLWMVVKRTINGATVRHIEYLTSPWALDLDQSEDEDKKRDRVDYAFFVDCGLSYNNPVMITDISKANPGVVEAPSHGLENGDYVRLRNIYTMAEVNQQRFIVANKTIDTFELTDIHGNDVDTSGYTTFMATDYTAAYREADTFAGLDHLEGETLSVVADGQAHAPVVVSGGAVTLTRGASLAHFGLPYVPAGETMGAQTTTGAGTDTGDPVSIHKVIISLVDTLGLKFGRGPNPDSYEQIPYTPDVMGRAPVPFTGFKRVPLGGGLDAYPSISFEQTVAMPFMLLAMYIKYESYPE